MNNAQKIEQAYAMAKDAYVFRGIDTEEVLRRMDSVSISLPCWQGDDIKGFEKPERHRTGGGLSVTGDYPGRARTAEELRMDLEQAFSLIPGSHRLNLHSIYGEFGKSPVGRDEFDYEHFDDWVKWARRQNLKLDFNATCFGHSLAVSGFTLSSKKQNIRKFWIKHVKQCRAISSIIGRELRSPCVHNLWIPDGMKDIPFDRKTLRSLLKESLDEIYAEEYPKEEMKDSLESKLFGIGSESYVVGSHEFYFGYAQSRGKILCLDAGHFHPTESLADKISAILLFFEELLLHLSRGIRWDSDHVVIQSDDLQEIADEIVWSGAMDRIHVALDFFDASMNRVGAWVIGARATLISILTALLQPMERLRTYEEEGNTLAKLALREESKLLPVGAIWDYYCLQKDVPPRDYWMQDVVKYESEVLKKRAE
jgi:L-rhamnose isomerase